MTAEEFLKLFKSGYKFTKEELGDIDYKFRCMCRKIHEGIYRDDYLCTLKIGKYMFSVQLTESSCFGNYEWDYKNLEKIS